MRKHVIAFALFLCPLVANAQGYFYDKSPGPWSGGSVSADIALGGNKLVLDADLDSYIYASADDVVDHFVGSARMLRLSSAGIEVGGNLSWGTTPTSTMLVSSGTRLSLRVGDDSTYGSFAASTIQGREFSWYIDGYYKMLWGTGSPEGAVTAKIGSLYFQTDGTYGTSLWTKTAGTGNTGWSAVPSVPVDGTGVLKQSISVTTSTSRVPAANAPDLDTFAGSVIAVNCFPDGSDTYLYATVHMPPGADTSKDVTVEMYWSPDGTNTGNVDWEIAYKICNPGAACGADVVTSVQDAGSGTAEQIESVSVVTIAAAGVNDDAVIHFRIMRDGNDGVNDTLTDKACLQNMEVYYSIDDIGNRS